MLLRKRDQEVFKRWLLPKLDAISIAEAAVLADYVVELVTSNDADATIKANCLESLSDFLQDATAPFVDDVFKALKDRSYTRSAKPPPPSATAPIPSIVSESNSQYENTAPFSAPTEPAAARTAPTQHLLPDRPIQPSPVANVPHNGTHMSRKRKLMEHDSSQLGRPSKQPLSMPFFENLPSQMPPPPPGPLPFNPNDPASFAAFMAAMGLRLPAISPLTFTNLDSTQFVQQTPKARCEDYYTRGFCALGEFCPFDHDDAVARPREEVPEYDPEQSFLALQPHGKSKKTRVPRTHARDRSNTTLVVEQIPFEQCNPGDVHEFFSQFGIISEMQLDNFNQTAMVRFQDRKAATKAYRSPKAVFENRFVKVYWQKSKAKSVPVKDTYIDFEVLEADMEEEMDLEEVKKRQDEAQKAFEERRQKMQETDARAEEIEKQLRIKDEEITQVKQQLMALGDDTVEFERHQSVGYADSLAILQAEADDLFDQRDYYYATGSRGRGHYHPTSLSRGRGFRGAYRGRGTYGSIHPTVRSSVRRLDFRPRRLAVMDIKHKSSRDEALRQYLLNTPDCTSVVEYPEQADQLILTFKERYQAEIFIDNSSHIPNVGKLDLAWIPNDAFGGIEASTTTTTDNHDEDSDGGSSVTVGQRDEPLASVEGPELAGRLDGDLDVADDVDHWR